MRENSSDDILNFPLNGITEKHPTVCSVLCVCTKSGYACACVLANTQRARKLKKVQAKKLVKSNKSKNFFREIAFLAVLNFFPVQKLISSHF